jgi:predicted signal transduction protein with EAL and GGDEF domain/DNA-binding response OmpR family regulator
MTVDAGRARPLVLLVDDEPAMRLVTTEALEGGGFDVVEAGDGEAALEAFARVAPDVVLLDVRIPGRDGYQVCTALRAMPVGAQTPVVMITSLDDEPSIDRAYQHGATDFVTKPIHYGLLVHRLRYLLRTARKMTEARESERRLAHAQRMARIANWEWSFAERRLELAPEAADVFGLPLDGGDGMGAILRFVHADDRARVEERFVAAVSARVPFRIEYRMVAPDGVQRVVSQEAQFVVDELTSATRLVGTLQDITAVKQAERKMLQMAYYDVLTGLPNRTFLREQLGLILAEARRYRRTVAVMGVDLDRFERINDTFGHGAGDEVLKEAAMRMRRALRTSDTLGRDVGEPGALMMDGDTVARIGGDEFVAVLGEVRTPDDASLVARRLIEEFARPFELRGSEMFVTATVGIAVYPDDGEDVETLLRHAELAMHDGKESGRSTFRFYARVMNERAQRRIGLESGLRTALERGEFVLHYQPRVQLADGRPDSVEALVRWQHPQRGLVPPGEFIPVAEDSGAIVPIGEWVLRAACADAARWNRELPSPIRVAVNISARQFQDPQLAMAVGRALRDTKLDPALLEVEITEGVVMQDAAAAKEMLSALRTLGVRVALDDFGTGYSSLSYLTRFPVDTLKVDRSFVREALSSKASATITGAIIALSRSLGLTVVAEGIETEEQLAFLREQGCAEGQGFLFAKPMPLAELRPWLEARLGGAVLASLTSQQG